MLAYQIKRPGRPVGRGVTQPINATIAAVLKSDSEEVPTCVYNEFVAQRLAELLHLPVAQGALIQGVQTYHYASFIAATMGRRLPDIVKRLARKVVAHYPQECAGILVFDVLIGNWDRSGNIKAAMVPPTNFFCAFDHSHSLLFAAATPEQSVQGLGAGLPMMTSHLFLDVVEAPALHGWLEKLASLPAELIANCCCPGQPVNTVTEALQAQLARALIARRSHLADTLAFLADPRKGVR